MKGRRYKDFARVVLTTAAVTVLSDPLSAQGPPLASFPTQLADTCVRQSDEVLGTGKACTGVAHWVQQTDATLENSCASSTSVAEKVALTNGLLWLQNVVDLLALYNVLPELQRTDSSLCRGLLDESITYLTVDPTDANLVLGAAISLIPTVHCSNGTCVSTYQWTSTDPSIATVDENGRVAAIGVGSTFITAVSQELPSLTVTIGVTVQAEVRTYVLDSGGISGTWFGTSVCGSETVTLVADVLPSVATVRITQDATTVDAFVSTAELAISTAPTCGPDEFYFTMLTFHLLAGGAPGVTGFPVIGTLFGSNFGFPFSMLLTGFVGTVVVTDSELLFSITKGAPQSGGFSLFSGTLHFVRVS
jgi:hypothetical protein